MLSFFASTANGFDLSARARRFTLVLAAVGLCFASLSVKAENDELPATANQMAQQAVDEAGPANDIEGIYEAVYEDAADGKFRLRHFLNVDGQRQELHLKQSVSEVVSGAKVRVRGIQQDDGSITQEDGTVLLTLAAGAGADGGSNGGTPGVLANTTGEQRTLVLLANFKENPTEQTITTEQARSLVFGQVSDFFYESSYQKTTLAGDVYGWLTLPVSNTVCDLYAAGNAADQLATSAGIDLSSYTRIVYLFTKTPCSVSGMGTVGGAQTRSYINGQMTADNIAHEMGHNFGLYHSHALDCNGETLGNTCSTVEYGDSNDTMGNPDFGHFNAFQKSRLGWVGQSSASPVTVASTSGSYTVGVYEAATSEAKAIKIPRGINPLTGNQTWFYVEYRQSVGFDSFLSKRSFRLYRQDVTNGVVIHLAEDNAPNSSQLLHMHLDSPFRSIYGYTDWLDPALPVGKSYTDPVSGVTISADWADSASAGITVSVGQQTCTQTKPVVALSSQQSTAVIAGTSVSYDVTVTNQDSSQCSTATVNLSAVLPTGWTGTFDATSLSLAPGATGTTRLTVKSATTAPTGTYSINTTAANGVATTTVAANYSVVKANLAPVATNDSVTISSIAAVTIPVLANDYDPEGSAITVVAVGQGLKGSATLNANGSITYVPSKSFKGSDTFTYSISDGQVTATASVTVTLGSSGTTTGTKGRR